MITDIQVVAKPTALQVPEDIGHNEDRRADFFVELAQFGATGIDWMGPDQYSIPHLAFNDWEGNYSVAFLGEFLVKWGTFPEIQVYSEDRFFQMFAIQPHSPALPSDWARWATKQEDVYTGI